MASCLGLQEDDVFLGYRKVLVLTFRELKSFVQVGQKCRRGEYERDTRVAELMKLFRWCARHLSDDFGDPQPTYYAQLMGETLRPAQWLAWKATNHSILLSPMTPTTSPRFNPRARKAPATAWHRRRKASRDIRRSLIPSIRAIESGGIADSVRSELTRLSGKR